MELEKINTEEGSATTAREGGEIINRNFDQVARALDNTVGQKGDISANTSKLSDVPVRIPPISGSTISLLLGILWKWISDLVSGALAVGKATKADQDGEGRNIKSTYAEKTAIPTKLPADGGNADTVDGKHATDFIPATAKGTAGGIAQLDSTGKVPAAQLPSYVDDVMEYANLSAFPAAGETGKIYVAIDTNLTYRWSGTDYVEISQSIALGETSSTAYAGDKGKKNADDIADLKANKLDKTGDASDTTVTFVPESGELTSGAKQKTLWGRVAKKIAEIISGVIIVGKSNIANNLRSDKNFYLGYDGADGIDSPHVILGATATDSSNQSIIQRILPFNLTVGRAVNDENGNNIPKTYAKKDEITAVKVGGRNYITGLRDNWEGGIVSSDGTITTGNNYNQVTKDYQDIAFLAGKTAIASVNPDDVISGSERLKLSFRIAFYTLDYLFISYESSDYNMAYKTLTVPENAAYCKVSVGVDISGYVSGNFDKVRFQLELGNKETDYSPAPQDIPRINGEYPGIKVGKAMADGNGNDIPNTYAAKNGTYSAMTVGNAQQFAGMNTLETGLLNIGTYPGDYGHANNYVELISDIADTENTMFVMRLIGGSYSFGYVLDLTLMGYAYKDGSLINISSLGGYNTWWNNPVGNADKIFAYMRGGKLCIAVQVPEVYSRLSGAIYAGRDAIMVNRIMGATQRSHDYILNTAGNNIKWTVKPSTASLAIVDGGTYPTLTVGKAAADGNGNNIPATYATIAQLPTVTYSVDPPANPKNGDIHIVPTD